MNLFIIRHTVASTEGMDFEREITSDGKLKLLTKINFWKESFIEFDVILSSPLLRAKQTSEIIAEHFGKVGLIQVENSLKPGCKPSDLEVLLQIYNVKSIAVIGHEPDCSSFVSYFCKSFPPDLYFETAGLAHISFKIKAERGKGELINIK